MSDECKAFYGMLNRINDSLSQIEETIAISSEENYVNVFVLGVPRSGTTLATQIIFNNMKICCTNNLMARFWKAPLIGVLLSKEILGDLKGSEYISTYGTTHFPWEPHEFSWFWHDLLGINLKNGFRYADSAEIEWTRVKAKVCSLNNVLKASMVHKPLELVGYYLDDFVQLFDRTIFVYLERDDLDVAYSIAQARLNNHDKLNEWWSSTPPEGKMSVLIGKPYNIQIAGQVCYLKEMYSEKLALVPENRLVRATYHTLCDKPQDLLEEIRIKTMMSGCEVPITAVPSARPVSNKTKDQQLVADLLSGFDVIKGMGSSA